MEHLKVFLEVKNIREIGMVIKKKYQDNDADSQSVDKHDDIRKRGLWWLTVGLPISKSSIYRAHSNELGPS